MAKNILVIDDEEIFLDLLETYLSGKGYEVTVSTSGQKILKLLFEKPYDAVLLDVWMVDGSGIEVFKKIRKANPRLPVVLMTGYAASSLAGTLKELDVDAFIKKPFKLSQVHETIERVIADRGTGGKANESPPAPPSLDKQRYRLLVADDDAQYRNSLKDMFESEGFSVLTAADGEEAMQLFDANPGINVLVLDVKMPRMDGVELLKQVRQRDRNVTAIFITGVDDKDLHQRLVEEKGAYAVFQKPFSYKHFLRFVEMTEQLGKAREPEQQ